MIAPAKTACARKARRAIAAAMLVALDACGTGLQPELALRMAVPRESAFDPARARFDHALGIGNVKAATGYVLHDSGGDLRDALKESLFMNGLLARDPATAPYHIEIDADFDPSNIFKIDMEITAHYRVVAATTNETILDEVVLSNGDTAWPRDEGKSFLAMLTTRSSQLKPSGQDVYARAVRNNIRFFFDRLAQVPALPRVHQ